MFRRKDPRFGEAVRALVEAINAGGIYDHLGGGYARYSTDAEWLVPHFEKMLYDNAQILELLALVHALWPDPVFADRARETVGWLMREMRVGRRFRRLARRRPGRRGRPFLRLAGRGDRRRARRGLGARSRRPTTSPATATGKGAPSSAASRRRARPTRRRTSPPRAKSCSRCAKQRPRPGRDDKVLADWNGLAIAALARASAVFDEPEWLATARSTFDFVTTMLRGADGRLLHAWRDGRAGARGMLDDYAVDGPRRARAVRGERRSRRPRGGPAARGRGARPVRRRRGRRLPDRRRRRRRSGRSPAARPRRSDPVRRGPARRRSSHDCGI